MRFGNVNNRLSRNSSLLKTRIMVRDILCWSAKCLTIPEFVEFVFELCVSNKNKLPKANKRNWNQLSKNKKYLHIFKHFCNKKMTKVNELPIEHICPLSYKWSVVNSNEAEFTVETKRFVISRQFTSIFQQTIIHLSSSCERPCMHSGHRKYQYKC